MSQNLADLPPELFLDNLFSFLSTADLLRLAVTSKYFASMCSDEIFWKRRLHEDFNFDGEGTARRTGWKFIYRGLYRPRVYVWGERANGRLGLKQYPEGTQVGVPFPVQLDIPGARIVKLIAGGMSFHALDTEGNVYVWGTLNGSNYALDRDGFSESGKKASTPLLLQLPNAVRSISCGRLHSCALDTKNRIWTFVNWGRPFELSSPLLSQPESAPLQIECGWGFSSVLMADGEVLVWWPSRGRLGDVVREEAERLNAEGIGKAEVTSDDTIPCHTWKASLDPVLLPSLPPLPDIADMGEDYKKHPPKLVKIGGMDSHLVGLTNYGHVVIFRGLDHEEAMGRAWEYLPEFSELTRLRELPAFSEGKVTLPETLKVTHISAHFNHFFAFSTGSSSIVLQGETSTTPEFKPEIIPELQHKDIISVEIGDYHSTALAANGKLYTWGKYSHGALGLGDPQKLPLGSPGGFRDQNTRNRNWSEPDEVRTPTEVRFDHGRKEPKNRFCFSATAAGWHTGALVIDLEPDAKEEDDKVHLKLEEQTRRYRYEGESQWQNPPLVPHMPHRGAAYIHRIGFAGRGMNRGGRGGGPIP
ncbi:hypothetical protein D9756_007455 [Leucocoprinus leucothites]|uniref:F-box domain-containing protein n=1 Tax=Leucocoprinus leucothites TaxID=201217 RepID=A0A8H5FX19_9AGAR|nr:hypothetical protein D9756_007455 [Leucoagaricus leucothites]